MTDRAAVTAWIRDVADRRLDAVLADRGGFVRAPGSVTFARRVPEGRQRIHLDLMERPSYSPDSYHLGLRASISFPAMATVGAELFGRAAGGFGRSGNVDIVALDHIEQNPPTMLFASAEQLAALCPEIERHLLDSVVPYLDERDTIAKLTAANLRQWTGSGAEPGGSSRLPVIVAAGQLTMGDARQALETLQAAYPQGTRGRALFADAFPVAASAL